jgi:hypothetical protein
MADFLLSPFFLKDRAFCKTKIFVQNQGMREILPQAYD